MADNTDLLNKLINTVEEIRETQQEQGKAITAIQVVQQEQGRKLDEQGRDIKSLKGDVTSLKKGQENLELKVEVFHTEQTKANTEILNILTDLHKNTAKDTNERFERIEKRVNLPPWK